MSRGRPTAEERSGGVGGAAGDAGVEYRRAVAAYLVAHGLAGMPVAGFGVAQAEGMVSAVALETDDPVDDVRVEFENGKVAYIQAKRTLRRGTALTSAVEQWVKAGQRGLETDRDRLVLVTASASGPVRTLQRVLDRLKTDRPASFTEAEEESLAHLRCLMNDLNQGDQGAVLRCASIHVLEVEGEAEAGGREARLLLRTFVDPADAVGAWRVLLASAGVAARLRGGYDMAGWFQQLRAQGIAMAPGGSTVAAQLDVQRSAADRYIAETNRRASTIDLRLLGARLPPIRIESIDADVEVHDEDGRGTNELLWSFVRRHRAILTGLPGAGKSTALLRLAAQLHQIDDWLPISASLRDVDRGDHSLSFRDRLLAVATRDAPPGDRPLLVSEFSRRLDTGSCVLLLDGLDETYQRRATVVTEVDTFVHSCSDGVAILLSTRDVAYGHAATLGWPNLRLAPPGSTDRLVAAILEASRDATLARGETADDDWVQTRLVWVHSALAANPTLTETPLIPTLLALLAGERTLGALPTLRADVMQSVVESLLFRQAQNERLAIGQLQGDAAIAAAEQAFRAIARLLIAGGGSHPRPAIKASLTGQMGQDWGLTPGHAEVAAELAIRVWDEHGIFVVSGADEIVAPRLPLFAEIGDAMTINGCDEADIRQWVDERIAQGAVESLVLAAGLNGDAADAFLHAAAQSGETALLHGAARAILDGATPSPVHLQELIDVLITDVAGGDTEAWSSLSHVLRLPLGETTRAELVGALESYPPERRAIGRALVALRSFSAVELRDDPKVLLEALATGRLKHLPSRTTRTTQKPISRLGVAVDQLYSEAIERSAETLLGFVDEATALVTARLRTVSVRTHDRLLSMLRAAGHNEVVRAEQERMGLSVVSSMELLKNYDPDDYLRFLEQLAKLHAPAAVPRPESTTLDHLADFVATMGLNDAGSWGKSFDARKAEVVSLVRALGDFDSAVLAAQAEIVLQRQGTFESHKAFFSLFEVATERDLDHWEAVQDQRAGVSLLVDMLAWGIGSAQLASRALWNAPVSDLAAPLIRSILPRIAKSTDHQRVAALTLCSLVGDPEPLNWLDDANPVLRDVVACWIEPVGPDGRISREFHALLFDPDRNVRGTAVERLINASAIDRNELLGKVAAQIEPGWMCLSCRTANPAGGSSCASPTCARVPSHPAADALAAIGVG